MRLIDADELLKEQFTYEYDANSSWNFQVVKVEDIDNAPTIDAVSREVFEKVQSEYEDLMLQHPDWKPIVYCKECAYASRDEYTNTGEIYCKYHGNTFKENDFCSYGEDK